MVVVQLQFPAFGVFLCFHISLNRPEVLLNVSFLGEDLDLDLHRGDLHPACEIGNDVLLLRDTAKQEVDRLDLNHTDISTIRGLNDAISDIFDRDKVFRLGGLFLLGMSGGLLGGTLCRLSGLFAPLTLLGLLLDADPQLLRRRVLRSCRICPGRLGFGLGRLDIGTVEGSAVDDPPQPVDQELGQGITFKAHYCKNSQRQRDQAEKDDPYSE